MLREYHNWYSPALGRHMELLVFGHQGAPLLVFPSSMGRFFEFEDRGMIGTLSDKIDGGYIQVYCIDSIDLESWYNKGAHPYHRVQRHLAYDRYITDEVVPLMRVKNSNGYMICTGASFGATQAVNFAFRHPELVHRIIAMSGRYSMHSYLDGYFDDSAYYNSPLDYIGGMDGGSDYANKLRVMQIHLMAGQQDLAMCLNETRQLSELLWMKGIGNSLEIWNDCIHDWPCWREQIRQHI